MRHWLGACIVVLFEGNARGEWSPYQLQLLPTVQSLKNLGWTDLQIADHFNRAGWLTPIGHRWIAQSVISIRETLIKSWK